MKTYSDKTLMKMLEYLTWCERASRLRGDFLEKFIAYTMTNFNWSQLKATQNGKMIWSDVEKNGLTKTYQDYIGSHKMCAALTHAMNIHPTQKDAPEKEKPYYTIVPTGQEPLTDEKLAHGQFAATIKKVDIKMTYCLQCHAAIAALDVCHACGARQSEQNTTIY